ncbi:lasso peptide biosynthesis B2 protein [Lachnospiraceae bacterium C1.1]|nr:lasso peptide biosynthesis B2 protein [Lachnospiraceae bacterium C1.1]
MDIRAFIFDNGEKLVTVKAYIYSFYYRLLVKKLPMKKLEGKLGVPGVESAETETDEKVKTAKLYAFHVNRITCRLPWEAKCFVRALTLRKLLREKNIGSTIYLGVFKKDGKLKAHAWLRCGQLYLTGGNGEGMTVVAKFGDFGNG